MDSFQKTLFIILVKRGIPRGFPSGVRFGLLCGILLLLASDGLAQEGRKEGFRFLETVSDVRLSALGGHHAALLDIHGGAYRSNPAFLADLLTLPSENSENSSGIAKNGSKDQNVFKMSPDSPLSAGLTSGRLPAGITLAGVHVQKAFTIQHQPVMLLTGVHSLLYGKMDLRSENGEILGEFRSHDLEWSVGGATRLSDRLSAGITLSVLGSQYDQYRSSALAIRAGLYWASANRQTALGLVMRNAGVQLSEYLSVSEDLPLRVSVGITHKPTYFPARLMATLVEDLHDEFRPDWLTGAEFLLGDAVRFRLGYNHRTHADLKSTSRIDLSGVQTGIGVSIKEWTLDLSRSSWGRLGGIFQIGISKTSK